MPANDAKEQETVSLWQTTQNIRGLYGNSFGFSKGKRHNTFLLILLIALNLCFIVSLAALDTAFSSLMGILSLPNLSYSLFFQHSLQFLFAATSYQTNRVATSTLGRKIADRLSQKKNFINQWIDDIGHPDYKKVDMTQCSNSGRRDNLYKIFTTFNSFLITLTSGLLSLYKLWLLATPVAFILLSTPITIPYYILIASLLYPLGYNTLFSYMSQGYQETFNQKKEQNRKLEEEIRHISREATKNDTRGMAASRMKNDFKKLENEENKPSLKYQHLKEILTFLQDLYSEFSVAIGILFAAPMLVAKTISIPMALLISDYFRRVANLFAWSREKHDDIAAIRQEIHTLQHCEKLFRIPEAPRNYPSTLTTPVNIPKNLDYIVKLTNLEFNPKPNQTVQLSEMTIHSGDVIEVEGCDEHEAKLFTNYLSSNINNIRDHVEFHCEQKQIILKSQLPTFITDTVKNTLYNADGDTPLDKGSAIQQICDDFGIPQHLMQEKTTALSPATKQRLALAISFAKYPPDAQEFPPLIILNNALSDIPEKNHILKKIMERYPQTAIIYIPYGSERTELATHRLVFQKPHPETGITKISFEKQDIIIEINDLTFDHKTTHPVSTPQYQKFHLQKMKICPGDIIDVEGCDESQAKLFTQYLTSYTDNIGNGINFRCELENIILKEPLPALINDTVKNTICNACIATALDKDRMIEQICNDLDIPQYLMQENITELSLAKRQRLALAMSFAEYPANAKNLPALIILDGALAYVSSEIQILKKIIDRYPHIAILRIRYNAERTELATHRLIFEKPHSETDMIELSFTPLKPPSLSKKPL
jgi:ABC-type iron transport system FetAB ATPase subunit/ABC-type multidrug transport system fused ATPase/permease subunit